MKTIKIFLASSDELKDERSEMTDLVYQLNKLFKSRGIELDLERWEYLDASMSNQRKQDEYNDVLKQCDICMVLFWRKFGSFTGEELDVAYRQMKNGGKPQKIYIFFKNPSGDDISSELKDFMQGYEQRYGGHFFCKFQNADAMKLEFLLQLELYQKDQLGENAIEVRQEHVLVNGEPVADLNNIPFAANNAGFKKMKAELEELEEEISGMQVELEKKRQKLERKKAKLDKDPDDEDYKEEYQDVKEDEEKLLGEIQNKIGRKNKLNEEFENEQQSLFNTARRITELRGQRISARMGRAIEAFEKGDAQRADALLGEAEHDTDEVLADIRAAKQVGWLSLEELKLKASVKMVNDTLPIEKRVEETRSIYAKADNLAQEIDYDKKKYASLLRDYGEFLKSRDVKQAVGLFRRQSELLETIYGFNNVFVARAYDDIAKTYTLLGGEENFLAAWPYLEKALEIKTRLLGENHQEVAETYEAMGVMQIRRMQYSEAKESIGRAIEICESAIGTMNIIAGRAYRDMGRLYERLFSRGKENSAYMESLKYHLRAIDILEHVAGEAHEATLSTYNNLAVLYNVAGEYEKALELHRKALDVKEKVLGFYHLSTAIEYNNMGNVYYNIEAHEDAMECYQKALKIKKKVLKDGDYSFSNTYKRMGVTSMAMGNYTEAEKYLSEALEIRRNHLKEGDERIAELVDELERCRMTMGGNSKSNNQ